MRLKTLELTHFRCFESLQLNLHPQMTVLVAANGEGKTSVLDAIATGLGAYISRFPQVSGILLKDTDLRMMPGKESLAPYARVACEALGGVKWDLTKKRDQSKKTAENIPKGIGQTYLRAYADQFIHAILEPDTNFALAKKILQHMPLPIIAYYGTGRGVFSVPQRRRNFRKEYHRFQAYEDALESKTNFRHYFEWFYYMEDIERRGMKEHRDWDYRQPELEAVRQAIAKTMSRFDTQTHQVIEWIENPRTEVRPLRFVVDWHKNGQVQRQIRIEQLSDGYRTTLALVMDIASRMAKANPGLAPEKTLETPGIVLIDEVDLHLHPSWQQRILPDLKTTFPNIQFIVTTHSPQVLSSIASESIRILKQQQIFSTPAGTQGAEAQRILNDVFGVASRPQQDENTQLLKKYLDRVYADQWQKSEVEDLRAALDLIYQGNEPALFEADLYIANRKWELASDEEDSEVS